MSLKTFYKVDFSGPLCRYILVHLADKGVLTLFLISLAARSVYLIHTLKILKTFLLSIITQQCSHSNWFLYCRRMSALINFLKTLPDIKLY